MRFGTGLGDLKLEGKGFEKFRNLFRKIEADGFDTGYAANHLNHDAMTLLAVAGQATTTLELETSVVPTYPRHPFAMAQQALTTSQALDGRCIGSARFGHAAWFRIGSDDTDPLGVYIAVAAPW